MSVCLLRSGSDRVSSGRPSLQILARCQETGHLVQMILGESQIRTGCTGSNGTAATVVLRRVVREVTVVVIYRIHIDVTVVTNRRHRHITVHVAFFHERRAARMRVNRCRRTHGHVRTTAAGTRAAGTVHFTVGTLQTSHVTYTSQMQD